jgi:hypothetical protein
MADGAGSAPGPASAEAVLADAYARAYGTQPQTDEELAGTEAELREAVREEPW